MEFDFTEFTFHCCCQIAEALCGLGLATGSDVRIRLKHYQKNPALLEAVKKDFQVGTVPSRPCRSLVRNRRLQSSRFRNQERVTGQYDVLGCGEKVNGQESGRIDQHTHWPIAPIA